MSDHQTERLHKYLARAGVASRRSAERMIASGRVRVNGAIVEAPVSLVEPERDEVQVDGRPVHVNPKTADHTYILLNKPVGVISSASDPQRRPTVVDLVRSSRRLYPVGRLDVDSEGLMLLTDDGEVTFRLTQARFGVEKEYEVLVPTEVCDQALHDLTGGIGLDDGLARAKSVRVVARGPNGTRLRIVLVEGRQRQVRRMLMALAYQVDSLRRVRVGPLHLGTLPRGGSRPLGEREAQALRHACGLGGHVPEVARSRAAPPRRNG